MCARGAGNGFCVIIDVSSLNLRRRALWADYTESLMFLETLIVSTGVMMIADAHWLNYTKNIHSSRVKWNVSRTHDLLLSERIVLVCRLPSKRGKSLYAIRHQTKAPSARYHIYFPIYYSWYVRTGHELSEGRFHFVTTWQRARRGVWISKAMLPWESHPQFDVYW